MNTRAFCLPLMLPLGLAASSCIARPPAADIPGKPSDLLVSAVVAPVARPLSMNLAGDGSLLTWTERGSGASGDLYAARREGDAFGAPMFLSSTGVLATPAAVPAVASLGGEDLLALYFGASPDGHQADLYSVDGHGRWNTVDHSVGVSQEGRVLMLRMPDGHVAAFWKRHVEEPGTKGMTGINFAQYTDGFFETPRAILARVAFDRGTTGEDALPGGKGGVSDDLPGGDRDGVCDRGPLAAASASDGMVIAWRDFYHSKLLNYFTSGIQGGVIIQRNFRGYALSQDDWHVTPCPADGPSAAASGHTVFLASWSGDHEARVRYQTSTNDGRDFTGPTRVDAGHPEGRVAIGALDDKSAVVVWEEEGTLLARHVTVSGEVGSVVRVAMVNTLADAPVMVKDGKGLLLGWIDGGKIQLAEISRKP